MLHSAFWNHGATELELSPLWQALVQGPEPDHKPMEINGPAYSGVTIPDFLYPSGALNLIRQCSPWITDRHESRRSRIGVGRLGHRLYTSAAGDGAPGTALAPSAKEETDVQDEGNDLSVEDNFCDAESLFLQAIVKSKRKNDYEEAWRQFEALSPENQRRFTPQLLNYFITSSRPIDAERTVSVFERIRDDANYHCYEAFVKAHVVLRNFDAAVKAHSDSMITFYRPIGTDRLLGGLIEHSRWDMAFETWKTLRDFEAKESRLNDDIWRFVVYLPDLPEKALQLVADLTNHFVDAPDAKLSEKLSQDKVSFLTEVLSKALFPAGDFSEDKFKAVFLKLEMLGTATESIYKSAILELLKMGRSKQVVHLYRRFRKTDGKLTSHILDAVLKIFCKHKSYMGMHQILEDWVRYFGKPSSPAYRMCMTAFASQGNVKIVKELWEMYLARQENGRIRNADDLLPLMHVHAKRGEVEEVVNIFEGMEDEYNVVPNINHSNILLNAYGKVHAVDKAFEHYHKLLDSDNPPNKITIATMMGICTQRGDARAAYELYFSAQDLGLRPNVAMVDCLVLGDIQNDNLAKAEKTCVKALTMVLDGPRTRMWNYLLVAYAMRRDLDNVSRVHQLMRSANVPYDAYTYSALMQALAVAGQPTRAWKILTEVMPEAGIPATEFHYAVLMGGFIATKEIHMVFQVRNHMLRRSSGIQPGVSSNIQILKAAAMEDSRRMGSDYTEAEFAKADEYFFQFLMNGDRQEIASTARKGIGREPIDIAYTAAYFDFYMFICGQHKAFDRVKQLYDRFLELLPENRRSQPPIKLLSALMISRYNENDHQGVQEAWEFALERAKQQGRPITAADNLILYSHRMSLCRPLSTQIRSLALQGKLSQLKSTIMEVRAVGFELDSNNWNLYVQALVKAYKYQEAFELCESRLMPGWLGWAKVRQIEPRRNRLSIKDRARKKDPSYLRPVYHTLLLLSKAYVEMEGAQAVAGKTYDMLQHLEEHCPLVLNAIRTMRRTEDELERNILGVS